MADADRDRQTRNSGIAIIGFAGRFPGAPSADEFWELLAGGIEARTLFGDDELIRGGVRPADLANPRYVKAGFVLDDVDLFLFASSWQVDSASIPVIQKPGAPPASAGRGQGEGRSREGFPFLLYGDLDGSGFVDQADLLLFVEYWADRPR